MEHKSNFVSTIFMAFAVATVLCRSTFWISKFHKCPPEKFKFLSLAKLTLEQCVEECTSRKRCQVVGYKRLYHLCELYASSLVLPGNRGHCVMITKDDMQRQDEMGIDESSTICDEWEVIETTGNEIKCVRRECKSPTLLENQNYLGNMNQIGSKRAIICNTDDKNTKTIECMADGNWYDNQTSEVTAKCPSDPGGWIRLRCTEIQFQTQILSYTDATAICKSAEAKLVKIDKQWKMDVVTALIQTCPGLSLGQYWVDGSEDSSGAWTFSDDTLVPMDKYFWKSHAPDGVAGCIRMVRHAGDDIGEHRFDDNACTMLYSFICERTMP